MSVRGRKGHGRNLKKKLRWRHRKLKRGEVYACSRVRTNKKETCRLGVELGVKTPLFKVKYAALRASYVGNELPQRGPIYSHARGTPALRGAFSHLNHTRLSSFIAKAVMRSFQRPFLVP